MLCLEQWGEEDCCIEMYVGFKLYCEPEKQLELHKRMRIKIPGWEKQVHGLELELTYHPGKCFLQAVLNLNIRSHSQQRKDLSEEEVYQIPEEILKFILSERRENHITFSIENHGKEMDCGRNEAEASGKPYWWGMQNEEIVKVCSNGTRIAFEILGMLEENGEDFKDDSSLRDYIIKQIQEKLDADFKPCTEKFGQAFHEVVNPLGIWGKYSESLGYQNEEEMFNASENNHGLELIKARSLDCRMMFITW